MDIRIERSKKPFKNPSTISSFGEYRTPHFFLMDYKEGEWRDPRIVPLQDFQIGAGAKVFHYAHSFFEGAKAFKHEDGELYTFRFIENAKRFNKTADFLQMPSIPLDDQLQAVHQLLDIDRAYYPENEGASLYIRPFMIGSTDQLGIKSGNEFIYSVMLSPSGPYFGKGLESLDILIGGDFLARVAPGGMGSVKAAANYANNPWLMRIAKKVNTQQILFGSPYIEELGGMNHYHITKDGDFCVPAFTENILPSITARSLLEVASQVGLNPIQKPLLLHEFLEGLQTSKNSPASILEAGGVGTAAVVTPIASYTTILLPPRLDEINNFINCTVTLPTKVIPVQNSPGPYTTKLYELYTGIQMGRVQAPDGWLEKVSRF
ncbi:MAG: aminotransferase class IV [Nanoarchaeota archaeon]|nr:aminotransferase class IV [Nanoarchaeota archaeon]